MFSPPPKPPGIRVIYINPVMVQENDGSPDHTKGFQHCQKSQDGATVRLDQIYAVLSNQSG